jgi:hypothetical protein
MPKFLTKIEPPAFPALAISASGLVSDRKMAHLLLTQRFSIL